MGLGLWLAGSFEEKGSGGGRDGGSGKGEGRGERRCLEGQGEGGVKGERWEVGFVSSWRLRVQGLICFVSV